jgi:uncharacterized LabA/DUF88 family protein
MKEPPETGHLVHPSATPLSAKPRRIITYIDGFNLYFGMREKFGRKYHWLNLSAMSKGFLKANQTLVCTKYFTTRISDPVASVRRQTTYIEALQTLPDLHVYEGQYDLQVEMCPDCGRYISLHNEKMTDVNIAVELTKDAHADRFDTAIIVTGDSDQTPAIRMLKELFPTKRIICAFPPKRKSHRLQQEAHGFTHIDGGLLARCLLPPSIFKADGFELKRPPEWG